MTVLVGLAYKGLYSQANDLKTKISRNSDHARCCGTYRYFDRLLELHNASCYNAPPPPDDPPPRTMDCRIHCSRSLIAPSIQYRPAHNCPGRRNCFVIVMPIALLFLYETPSCSSPGIKYIAGLQASSVYSTLFPTNNTRIFCFDKHWCQYWSWCSRLNTLV